MPPHIYTYLPTSKMMLTRFLRQIRSPTSNPIYLIPLFADQAASEQGLRIQPAKEVESQL